MFFELTPRCVEAHKTRDATELKKIYNFAEWCFSQKFSDLWDAAAVAFYEHIADVEPMLQDIPRWMKPYILTEIEGIL